MVTIGDAAMGDGTEDPCMVAIRRTDGGPGHVLTCWMFTRVLGENSFQDADLTRMIHIEASLSDQPSQGSWGPASA